MMANGARQKTAARPRFKSIAARRSVVGAKGFLVVSKTATDFMIFLVSLSTQCNIAAATLASTMLHELFTFSTLTVVSPCLFNAERQSKELASAFVGVVTQVT
jgi:hypothetical protein